MESILSNNHYKKIFYGWVLLILALAIILRFLVLPLIDNSLQVNIWEFVGALLDGLVISLIVTIFIGGFIFWLKPEIMQKSVMEVIQPKEIGPLLRKSVADTKTWVFKGASGRYTRAVTLPSLAHSAKQEGLSRDIQIMVLNPKNSTICSEYATYRRSLKSGNNGSLSTEIKVREELLATIISALRDRHEQPLLRIELYLSNHFSAFRLDISDQYVIVTKEDKEAAGLRADAGTYFYDSYKDDVRLSERQSIKVTFRGQVPLESNLTEESLRALILEIDLVTVEQLNELDLSNIIQAIESPVNPYS